MLPGQLYWRNKSLKIQNQSYNLEVRRSFRTILKSYLHIGHFCSPVVVSATSFITFLARACLDEVLDWWYSYHDNQTRLSWALNSFPAIVITYIALHCLLLVAAPETTNYRDAITPVGLCHHNGIFQVQPIISCVQWNSRIFVYNICPIGISDTFSD